MGVSTRPVAVMLSKRTGVYYLEHVRVMRKDERVVFLTETGADIEHLVNIPDKNTVFLLLGTGSSITSAAVRLLAESNVAIGFAGSGGSPLLMSADCVFLTTQSEYRPTEYMQAWAKGWFDDHVRISMGKKFCKQRVEWAKQMLPEYQDLCGKIAAQFIQGAMAAGNVQQILLAEASYAKKLYGIYADKFQLNNFVRDQGKRGVSPGRDLVNSFLDHGNYLAYGYSAAVLHTMGISYAFPVLHGKTRRGGLVFDVADLFKDWLVLPLSFQCGASGTREQEYRAKLIEIAYKSNLLDSLFDFLKSVSSMPVEP